MGKFVIRRVLTGVKFDLRSGNGQTVLASQVYTSQALCLKGIESVRKNAALGRIQDLTADDPRLMTNPKFEIYRDRAGEYRFRLRARNGSVIAASDGYSTRSACRAGIESTIANAADSEIVTQ